MTLTQLHKETGISQNALSLLANGKSKGFQFSTLEGILRALDADVSDLVKCKKEEHETIEQRVKRLKKLLNDPSSFLTIHKEDLQILLKDFEKAVNHE